MDLLEKVKENIKKYKLFNSKEVLILAVSGGVDSVVLLDVCLRLKKKNKLVVAHLNHSLRGKDSDQDQKFVKNLAKKYKLKFETKKVDVKKIRRQEKGNLEEVARNERYKFLAKVAKKHKTSRIITAHHADDQVETVLLNNLRGAGPQGLSGMGFKSPMLHVTCSISLIRPLLNIWRKEILKYQKEKNLPFCEDKSNYNIKITRNYLRLKTIPFLEKQDKQFKKKIWRESRKIKDLSLSLKPRIDRIYKRVKEKESKNAIFLNLSMLNQLGNNLKAEVLREAIASVLGDLKDIRKEHIISISAAVKNKNTGKKIVLPKKLQVVRDYDTVIMLNGIFKEKKIEKRKLRIGKNNIRVCGLGINLKIGDKLEKEGLNFDFTEVKFPIFVRSVLPGDSFKPKGLKGTKKLQDLFVDLKIPKRMRKLVPVIVDNNNEILGVLGIRQGKSAAISKKTKKILVIRFKKLEK